MKVYLNEHDEVIKLRATFLVSVLECFDRMKNERYYGRFSNGLRYVLEDWFKQSGWDDNNQYAFKPLVLKSVVHPYNVPRRDKLFSLPRYLSRRCERIKDVYGFTTMNGVYNWILRDYFMHKGWLTQ